MAPQNENDNPMGGFNPMFAPVPPPGLADMGNAMLQGMGLPSYQPRQNIFTSNAFAAQHPAAAGALEGALTNLAATPPAQPVQGFGAGLQQAAQGIMGGMGMRRQFAWQQAMAPMMMAQQMAQFQKQFAPEAITTKYGIVQRNPMTGAIAPGLSDRQIAGVATQTGGINGTNTRQYVHSLFPDATPDESRFLDGIADVTDGIADPDQAQIHLQTGLQNFLRQRELQQQRNITNQFSQQRIEQSQQRIQQEDERIGQMAERLGMDRTKLNGWGRDEMYRWGLNPVTGETLSAANAPPGMMVDKDGNVIPNAFTGTIRPTTTARGKAEQAQVIHMAGDTLISHIMQNANELGPVMGRFNSLRDFVGNPPPEYKGLAAEIQSWIALHPAAHGFRGLRAVEEFQKTFGGTYNSPESLIAGIRGAYNTMDALAAVGNPKTTNKPLQPNNPRNPNPLIPPQQQADYTFDENGLKPVQRQ